MNRVSRFAQLVGRLCVAASAPRCALPSTNQHMRGSGASDAPVLGFPEKFDLALRYGEELVHGNDAIDVSDRLLLDALAKQAQHGACNAPRPSLFDAEGRARYSAWCQLGNTSKMEAMFMCAAPPALRASSVGVSLCARSGRVPTPCQVQSGGSVRPRTQVHARARGARPRMVALAATRARPSGHKRGMGGWRVRRSGR